MADSPDLQKYPHLWEAFSNLLSLAKSRISSLCFPSKTPVILQHFITRAHICLCQSYWCYCLSPTRLWVPWGCTALYLFVCSGCNFYKFSIKDGDGINDIIVKSRLLSIFIQAPNPSVRNSGTGQFSGDECSAVIIPTRVLPIRAAWTRRADHHPFLSCWVKENQKSWQWIC